ncbi:MAG: hydrogenase maturation protease [Bryobacteraceae bacterium]
MERSAGSDHKRVRLLGLGNELLADDAFGLIVARQAAERIPGLEVVCSSESGLALLDYLTGVSRLLIVDTIQTGRYVPGTLLEFNARELAAAPAGAPHGAGLREALDLGQALGLPLAGEVWVLAVEAADCTTIGGPVHPAVQAAIPAAVEWILKAAGA